MARTTAADVIAIMEENDLTELQVTPFVDSANVMVNQVMGTTETTDILTEIEKWLAAHMIAIGKVRQTKTEKAGTAEVSYTGFWTLGLRSTSYGQMVVALDTTGAFADLDKKKANIIAITSFE